MKIKNIFIALISCFCFLSQAFAASPTFEANKDYAVLKGMPYAKPDKSGNIRVIEFFSYGCHWCSNLEPELETWLKSKPTNIEFERVPVVFNAAWIPLAKAYYTAKALNVETKLTPALFKAAADSNIDLSNPQALGNVFTQNGVSASDFDSAYNFSPSIDAQMNKGLNLARAYNIMYTPTIIIAGQYSVDSGMSKGDGKRMMQTVEYLIKLAQNNPKSQEIKTDADGE